MNLPSQTKVFVVHAQPLVSAGLMTTLCSHSDFLPVEYPIDRASATEGQIETLLNADVLICDYESGVYMLKYLRSMRIRQAPARVLIVTHLETEGHIRFALDAGVSGYVLLECALSELSAAVRDIHRGARYISQAVSGRIVDGILGPVLTKRELEVVRLVGQGASNKVVASRLDITVGTVKAHMRTVLDKLGASNRVEAAGIVARRGLLGQSASHETNCRPMRSSSSAIGLCGG